MSIDRCEYWSVANMLISMHGYGTEEKAQLCIAEARENQQASKVIVWTQILAKIEKIRAET
jgi:hypothetical protein